MKRWIWICIVWFFAAGVVGQAFALDQEAEAHVRMAILGKALCLNHPNRASKLRFDAQGHEAVACRARAVDHLWSLAREKTLIHVECYRSPSRAAVTGLAFGKS